MSNTARETIERALDEIRDIIARLRHPSNGRLSPKPIPVRAND